MKISQIEINTMLQKQDIEGLIEAGAPADEYSSEAEVIASALIKLKKDEMTTENIAAAISTIWMKNFNLGQEEIALRMPAINELSGMILESISPAS